MSKLLTSEIARRILLDIGAATSSSFGKVGLTDSNFIIDKKIKIRYNSDKTEDMRFDKEHNIYAGRLKVSTSYLRAILIDLSIDNIKEYLFVFRFDNLPVHAIKYHQDKDDIDFIDLNYIRIFNDKKESWINTSIYMQSMLLENFERFVSFGLLWEDCKDYKDLYKLALTLIN